MRPWSSSSQGPSVNPDNKPAQALGLINLDVPHGAQLTSLTVSYEVGGTADLFEVFFSLLRTPLRPTIPPVAPDTLVDLVDTSLHTGKFRLSGGVSLSLAQVDLDAFRYFVTARVGLFSSTFARIEIDKFELTYIA